MTLGRRFADSLLYFIRRRPVATDAHFVRATRASTSATCVNILPDIDSAIIDMKRHGIDSIVLMGHSTGGLTTSLYMNEHPDTAIRALVLNSPFLDWNQSKVQEKVLIPAMQCIGRWWPRLYCDAGQKCGLCPYRLHTNRG